MFQEKLKKCMKGLCPSGRLKMLSLMLLAGTTAALAQNAAGDYTAGTTALGTVTTEIAKYVPYVVKLCYAIAGVVAIVGAISVYIKMNNEEQDVKKSIMMIQEVHHDDCGRMHLLGRRCTGAPVVLRHQQLSHDRNAR